MYQSNISREAVSRGRIAHRWLRKRVLQPIMPTRLTGPPSDDSKLYHYRPLAHVDNATVGRGLVRVTTTSASPMKATDTYPAPWSRSRATNTPPVAITLPRNPNTP